MIQAIYPLMEEIPLTGAVHELEPVSLNKQSWLSGDFQRYAENYTRENFGLRPNFVRFDNEFRYALFGKLNAPNLYEGDDKYIFRFYSKGYNFETKYLGADSIKRSLKLIEEVTELLAERGVTLIFAVPPAKHYFHSDKIPKVNQIGRYSDSTNYSCLFANADSFKVNLIDLNGYFDTNRDALDYPVFAKGGIHWTTLASFQGMKEVMRFGAAVSGKEVPLIRWTDPIIKKNSVDVDLVPVLNLNRGWEELELKTAYLIPDCKDVKPRVLVISDSFFNAPFWAGLPKTYFADDFKYWYYYSTEYSLKQKPVKLDKTKLISEVEKRDYVIIMSSIMNLGNIGWGVLQDLKRDL